MREPDLHKLTRAVEHLLGQESFAASVSRLKDELAGSDASFVWTTIPLSAIPCELPTHIASCWIFYLRKEISSGSHYHPNSVQHMVVVTGQGVSIVGGQRKRMTPFASGDRPSVEKWYVIDKNVPHEFIPEKEDMVVISFHTCSEYELEEVATEGGDRRLYEGDEE